MIKINQSEWLKGSRDFFDQSNDRNFSDYSIPSTFIGSGPGQTSSARTEFQLTRETQPKIPLKFLIAIIQTSASHTESQHSRKFEGPQHSQVWFLIPGPIPVWHLPDNGSWKEQNNWMSDQLVLNLSLESSLFFSDNNGCFEMSSARIPVLRQVSEYLSSI